MAGLEWFGLAVPQFNGRTLRQGLQFPKGVSPSLFLSSYLCVAFFSFSFSCLFFLFLFLFFSCSFFSVFASVSCFLFFSVSFFFCLFVLFPLSLSLAHALSARVSAPALVLSSLLSVFSRVIVSRPKVHPQVHAFLERARSMSSSTTEILVYCSSPCFTSPS